MQPKSLHAAMPRAGFRVLNEDAASAVVRRHARLSVDEPHRRMGRDPPPSRPHRSMSISIAGASPRPAAWRRATAALTSACVGVLAMTAIYLVLFFAAASHAHVELKLSAPVHRRGADPERADVIF